MAYPILAPRDTWYKGTVTPIRMKVYAPLRRGAFFICYKR